MTIVVMKVPIRKVQEEVVLTGPGVLDKTMLGVIWTIAFLYGCLSEQILSQVYLSLDANGNSRKSFSLSVT